ncbi:MAG: rhodanese-like domain-containing protein [Candidatus Gracilibacteria bacterium]|nr:rhodanese-like domain-containing protein [Candidatus Gracilibacteria bacterium]
MIRTIFLFLIMVTITSCGTNNAANNENVSATQNISNSVEQNFVYVDVRTDEEWNEGHVDGAIHLTLADVEAGKTEILPKDKELRVYCRSGRRSAQAIEALEKQGFTNLVNAGGMKDVKDITIVK